MKQNIAIILEFGFHDVKKYVHSGLTKELSSYYDIVWFILDKKNPLFNDYFVNTGFPIVYIQNDDLITNESKINSFNQSIRRSWMINNDLGLFHNYRTIRQKSIRTKIVGNTLLKLIFEHFALAQIDHFYNPSLSSELKRYSIDKILFTGYSSTLIKNIVATCEKMKIPSYCIINSWKDLYTNNFIPFLSNTKFMVWDEQMKSDFLFHMSYLKKDNIIVTGNPTFDYVIDSKPKFDRFYYAQKYDIPSECIWIYYTMMSPGILYDEIETLIFIAKELYQKYGNKYHVLIRRNPNHKWKEFCELALPNNTTLTEHFCEFDSERDMLVQSEVGEQEWLDLLHHTSINFSVPSTVTMEYMLLGKSVFNIAFDKNNMLDKRLNQFFKAGFYKKLFGQGLVYYIDSIDTLYQEIDSVNSTSSLLKKQHEKSVPKICEVIKFD